MVNAQMNEQTISKANGRMPGVKRRGQSIRATINVTSALTRVRMAVGEKM